MNTSFELIKYSINISSKGTVGANPRLEEERYATIDFSIISLSSIKCIKGCFGLTYVLQHKSLQPLILIQKKV